MHYEKKFNYLKQIIKKEKPIIVEVGSHWGQDTVRMIQTFKNVEIHCFEPHPTSAVVFKKLTKLALDGKKMKILGKELKFNDASVTFNELAVSDVEDYLDFYCTYRDPRESDKNYIERWIVGDVYFDHKTFTQPNLIAADGSSLNMLKKNWNHKVIKVKTVPLDKWASNRNIKTIDLLWIDVQGHEKQVIKGAINTLKNVEFIIMETGESEQYEGAMTLQQTVEFMKGYGFQKIKNLGNDAVFRRKK